MLAGTVFLVFDAGKFVCIFEVNNNSNNDAGGAVFYEDRSLILVQPGNHVSHVLAGNPHSLCTPSSWVCPDPPSSVVFDDEDLNLALASCAVFRCCFFCRTALSPSRVCLWLVLCFYNSSMQSHKTNLRYNHSRRRRCLWVGQRNQLGIFLLLSSLEIDHF